MKHKITIIGGSGFVGTNLCRALHDASQDFEILDIKYSKQFRDKCKICDVREIDHLREHITGDLVVNLAAIHVDNAYSPVEYRRTNVDGARNVVLACTEKKIKKIIFTSSVAVYGFTNGPTDEGGKINPFNEYGRSKFAGEEIYREWLKQGDHKLFIIRPTVIFGEGNRGNVYNLFQQIASKKFIMIGDGRHIKSLAYIHNFIAFLQACIASDRSYGLFNYVDTPDLTVGELVEYVHGKLFGSSMHKFRLPASIGILVGQLCEAWAKISGKKPLITKIRIKKFISQSHFTSAKSELDNFRPPFNLVDGLSRALEAEFISPDLNREIFFTE